MNVEFARLPVWAAGMLAAEYDAAADCIRVNIIAIERVRAALGDDDADAFVRCALAHERFHREHPAATEAQAHRHVREVCGEDPHRFEHALRTK